MIKLGTWPQDIYYLSWMTQRLANRAPEYIQARKWSWSTLQQILNPIGLPSYKPDFCLLDGVFVLSYNEFLFVTEQ